MKSILVIDDNRLIRQTFKTHLSSEGFDVSLASDGGEGVDQFQETPETERLLPKFVELVFDS